MKHLSLKILILCILAPPVLYIFTLTPLETYLQKRYAEEIEESYLGDMRLLLAGAIRLRDAVNQQVDFYLTKRAPMSWGVRKEILISTRRGTILYPVFYDEEAILVPLSPDEAAAENYNLMNEEIIIKVDLSIDHNTLLANILLGAYILVFAVILYLYYIAAHRRTRAEEMRKALEMQRLMEKANEYALRMETLDEERRELSAAYERLHEELRDDKRQASLNEDDLLKEIIKLEEAIHKNQQALEKQQEENDGLKEVIQRHEKTKRKSRETDTIQKRFKTLYKNLIVNPRAVEGYLELNEDMRIKCEEVIHQLNQDPKMVSVKRKVFTKKTSETVLEVMFAYNGRLYFRHLRENRMEILAIGNKATQAKDLAFIDGIAPDA